MLVARCPSQFQASYAYTVALLAVEEKLLAYSTIHLYAVLTNQSHVDV